MNKIVSSFFVSVVLLCVMAGCEAKAPQTNTKQETAPAVQQESLDETVGSTETEESADDGEETTENENAEISE